MLTYNVIVISSVESRGWNYVWNYLHNNKGFSLRELAKEYNVDKFIIKHILEINNISLRKTKTYKYSQEERKLIIDDSKIMPRKDVMEYICKLFISTYKW